MSMFSALAVVALAGCDPLPSSTVESSTTESTSSETSSEYVAPLDTHVTLDLSVKYQNDTTMKYTLTTPYEAADGITYSAGDFKPVWKQLQTDLNFTINDVTETGQSSVAKSFDVWANNSFAGVDVLNGPAAKFGQYHTNFIALDEELDRLPNLAKFLKKYPSVQANCTYSDGHMYFSPYFDGYDDLEKMFISRNDWVETILDADYATTAWDTSTVITPKYSPTVEAGTYSFTVPTSVSENTTKTVTKEITDNVITLQNETTRTGATLVQALRDYIDDAYDVGEGKTYAKRSDIFNGVDATYDADELVALFRCVKANPALLSGGVSTTVYPFYPRESTAQRYNDLFALASNWGVRGLSSRNGYNYIDKNGVLKDARTATSMNTALTALNQLYQEGLIMNNFDTKTVGGITTGKYRDTLNLATYNSVFMTYDYNQTSTILNAAAVVEGFNLAPVMPAVAAWDDGMSHAPGYEYFHFSESTRSVKTEGWAITSTTTGDELTRALALVDYMYSAVGNQLMSFGPAAWVDGTTTYLGETCPKMSAAALSELQTLAKGNYTNYFRRYLGGTLPVGYIKAQSMEYQCTNAKGQVGLEKLNKAIQLGTFLLARPGAPEGSTKFYELVPTVFPLTDEANTDISTNYGDLTDNFDAASDGYIYWADVVKGTKTISEYTTMLSDCKFNDYFAYYRVAYESYKTTLNTIIG